MALASGTKLGSYEVLSQIGAGGMGEVYRAHDTRLNRDVALKVIPETFAAAPDRMARFEREAKLLASLNHPYIASIYGLEETSTNNALVMELVEGPTLADRIAAGPIPLDEALPIAKQIAEGLEYAHDHGVIHRDLKPANIKVTPDGTVKVLDFGLAKAMLDEPAAVDMSNSPTLSMAATMAGTILGTAAYMSPEQAKGKPLDRRADIWAFGVVLFEMLTGKQLYSGETPSETLAFVMTKEPSFDALPANTPRAIQNLLRRCLEKNLKRRLQHIGEARIRIEDVLTGSGENLAGEAQAPAQTQLHWQVLLPWSLVVLLLVCGAAVWHSWNPTPTPLAVARLSAPLRPDELLYMGGGGLAFSPDGLNLAYNSATSQTGTRQLHLRPMNGGEGTPIPGAEDATGPFFSPDGQWIAFSADGKIKKIPLTGGTPIVVSEGSAGQPGSWGTDGTIFFRSNAGIMRVPAAGGTPQLVVQNEAMPGEQGVRLPELLPGGQAILYVTGGSYASSSDEAAIMVQSLKTGERKLLIQGGTNPHYLSTGHIIYAQGGRLLAVPFDLRLLEIKGAAAPVLDDVWQGTGGYAAYAISRAGTLVYVNGGENASIQTSLNLVDRTGGAHRLLEGAHDALRPNFSPDGKRLAVTNAVVTPLYDIWVSDLARGALTRLTFAKPGEAALASTWTSDGKRMIYSLSGRNSNEWELMWRPADGSGSEEMLYSSKDPIYPLSSSPDGQLLVFYRFAPSHKYELWILPLAGERKARPLIESPFNTMEAQISHDGRWLAFASDESGHPEVYVQPFPGLAGKWQVSTTGGAEPRWSRDGRELFYWSGDKMMVVEIETKAGFVAGIPHLLFDQPYAHASGTPPISDYDVSPDSQHFAMFKPDEKISSQLQLRVVLNWAEDVTRRLGAAPK